MKMHKKETRALTSVINFNFCPKSKRSQISETINWTVASIIIIVVLIFGFFLAKSDLFSFNFQLHPDKQQDFIITKSTGNFVNENFNLIQESVKSQTYSALNDKLNLFLKNLPTTNEDSFGWSFVLRDSKNKKLFETGHTTKYSQSVEFNFNAPDNFKIIFGEQCKECQPLYNVAH